MKRVAGYVRVSSEEQKRNGVSVDAQIEAIKNYCKENSFELVDIYNDAGISGRKSYKKRPDMLRLLEDCKAGKMSLVLFTKLDRWGRSISDYYEIQRVLDENGVKWRAIWEDYETETAAGVFKVNIMLSVSQSEADRTSERIRETNRYRAERGDYVGSHPPFGYVRGDDNKLHIDEDKREALRAIFGEYLSTFSLVAARKAGLEYGVDFDKVRLCKLFRNPTYAGMAVGYHPCEGIISWEDFCKVRERIEKKDRACKENRVYLFTGILYCPYCGGRMASKSITHTNTNGSVCVTKYYMCNTRRKGSDCKGAYQNEEKLERYLMENLSMEIEKYRYSVQEMREKRKSTEKLREALEAKLQRLSDLYADGDLSREKYVQRRDGVKAEIEALRVPDTKVPEKLPDGWQEVYKKLDDAHKKAFWIRTLGKVVCDRGKVEIFFWVMLALCDGGVRIGYIK